MLNVFVCIKLQKWKLIYSDRKYIVAFLGMEGEGAGRTDYQGSLGNFYG